VTIGVYCGLGLHNGAIARVAARHGKRTPVNLLFMDGHVRNWPIQDVQTAWRESTLPLSDREFPEISFKTIF
jgi:prepilin-type processing-associated H-X9-DG protein